MTFTDLYKTPPKQRAAIYRELAATEEDKVFAEEYKALANLIDPIHQD